MVRRAIFFVALSRPPCRSIVVSRRLFTVSTASFVCGRRFLSEVECLTKRQERAMQMVEEFEKLFQTPSAQLRRRGGTRYMGLETGTWLQVTRTVQVLTRPQNHTPPGSIIGRSVLVARKALT